MPDYAALAEAKDHLIRRGLSGAAILAPMTAELVSAETLFDTTTGAIQPLPEEYYGLGRLSDDGVALGREVESSDMTGWGSNSPVRSDITGDTSTMGAVAKETNMRTIGLYTGAPDSMLAPVNAGGAVEIKQPETTVSRYYRALSIARDTDDNGLPIYLCRFLPRSKVTSIEEQSHSNSEDGIQWGVTLTGYKDAAYGSPGSWLFGGEGWLALATDMGFEVPAGV